MLAQDETIGVAFPSVFDLIHHFVEDGQTQTALQILNTAVILDLLGRIEGWGGILKLNRQFTGRSLDFDVDLTVFDFLITMTDDILTRFTDGQLARILRMIVEPCVCRSAFDEITDCFDMLIACREFLFFAEHVDLEAGDGSFAIRKDLEQDVDTRDVERVRNAR